MDRPIGSSPRVMFAYGGEHYLALIDDQTDKVEVWWFINDTGVELSLIIKGDIVGEKFIPIGPVVNRDFARTVYDVLDCGPSMADYKEERSREAALFVYIKTLHQLHHLIAGGKGDSEEADQLRDTMDEPYNLLDVDQKELVNRLSKELYLIEEKEA